MRRRGFTLIEVLLALALFGVLSAALASALRTGLSAWKRSAAADDRHRLGRAILETLSRELRNAVPAPGKTLEGEESSLAFLTVRTAYDGEGTPFTAPMRVVYRQKGGGDGAPSVEKSEAAPGGEPVARPLGDGRAAIGFSYAYTPAKEGDPMRWEPRWTEDALPAGIKIRLSLGGEPDIFVLEKSVEIPGGTVAAWKNP